MANVRAFVVGLVATLVFASIVLACAGRLVVRVQSDRGHAVCTTGPYRVVRHPGNLGMIVGALGFPLLFQSTWCFIPATLFALSLVVRTRLEDELLTRELAGYRDYREHTRARLVPGLW